MTHTIIKKSKECNISIIQCLNACYLTPTIVDISSLATIIAMVKSYPLKMEINQVNLSENKPIWCKITHWTNRVCWEL